MRDEEPGGEPEQTTEPVRILRCASCNHPITRRSERIVARYLAERRFLATNSQFTSLSKNASRKPLRLLR